MQQYSEIFKALSDENRIKILEYVRVKCSVPCKGFCPDEACASELAELLGVAPATVSHHIKELVNARLLTTRKQGRWVFCKLNDQAISQAVAFLSTLRKEGV